MDHDPTTACRARRLPGAGGTFRRLLPALLAGVLTCCQGCVVIPPLGEDPSGGNRARLQEVADDLDEVARFLEEWGTLSMSGPMVTSSNEDFEFKLDLTDKELFEGNRAPAGAVSLRRSVVVKGRVAVDLARGGGGGSTGSAGNSEGGNPAESPGNTDSKAEGGSQEGKPEEKKADGDKPADQKAEDEKPEKEEVYEGGPAIPQRRRIRLTASDRFELGLHKLLSDPDGLPQGMKVYYLAFTVSCRPGWRTRDGFAGCVDARLEYMLDNEPLSLDPKVSQHPLVVAVYPAFETQELNLQSSYDQLIAIAGQLAAAGQEAGAEMFLEAAEKVERQAQTFTGLAQVTSYSHGGRNFGYEFRPAFRAMDVLGRTSGTGGLRLESVSFPAVAILLVDQAAVRSSTSVSKKAHDGVARDRGVSAATVREVLSAEPGDMAHKEALDELRTAVEAEREKVVQRIALQLHITHSWRPIKPLALRDVPVLRSIEQLFTPRLWEHDVLNQMLRLHRALSRLNELKGSFTHDLTGNPINEQTRRKLTHRWNMLQPQLYNLSPFLGIKLSKAEPPSALQVTKVEPSVGRAGADSLFLIHGSGFIRQTKKREEKASVSLVSPRSMGKMVVQVLSAKLISVTVTAGQKMPAGAYAFKVTVDRDTAFTPPFRLVDGPRTVTVTVHREDGQITGLTIPRDDSGVKQADFDRIRAILEAIGRARAADANQAAEVELKVKAQKK